MYDSWVCALHTADQNADSGDGEVPFRYGDAADTGGMVYVRKDKGSKGALRPLQQLQHVPVQACAAAGATPQPHVQACIGH